VTREATIAQLLGDAGAAHHQAFAAVHGADDAWPAWYAQWLMPHLTSHLSVSVQDLAVALTELDAEHQKTRGAAPWPEFYAERLIKKFG